MLLKPVSCEEDIAHVLWITVLALVHCVRSIMFWSYIHHNLHDWLLIHSQNK